MSTAEDITERIIAFIREIGIEVHFTTLSGKTFVPGITVKDGAILVDRDQLTYPGDLLHEAGHLAVLLPEERPVFHLRGAEEPLGNEIAAMAWSYAALYHLKLKPEVVFHEGGYKGASDWHIGNFTTGIYPGLPLLCWMGFCADAKMAAERGVKPYPEMLRWMRVAK